MYEQKDIYYVNAVVSSPPPNVAVLKNIPAGLP